MKLSPQFKTRVKPELSSPDPDAIHEGWLSGKDIFNGLIVAALVAGVSWTAGWYTSKNAD